MKFKTPAALSTDADVYYHTIGFSDNTGSGTVDGAFLYYKHSVSTNFVAYTSNNSTTTTASGGSNVVYTNNTWYDVIIIGNSSTVWFYLSSDDGATYTFLGSSSSNIPSTTGREFGIVTGIVKQAGSVGTNGRTVYLDRVAFYR